MSTTLNIDRDNIDYPAVFGLQAGRGINANILRDSDTILSPTGSENPPDRLITRWVRAVIDTNISSLSGSVLSSVSDAVALADGDRILLVGQTDGEENRIYIYDSSGDWAEFDVQYEPGLLVPVAKGGESYGSLFAFLDENSILTDASDLDWSFIGGAGLSGAGTANKLAYWSDAETIDDSSFLTVDETNNRLQINTTDTRGTLSVEDTSTNVLVGGDLIGNLKATIVAKNIADGDVSSIGIRGVCSSEGGVGVRGEAIVSSDYNSGRLAIGIQGIGRDYGVHAYSQGGLGLYCRGKTAAEFHGTDHDDNAVYIEHNAGIGDGNALYVNQEGKGRGIYISRLNSAPSEPLLEVNEQNASSDETTAYFKSSGKGRTLRVYRNNSGANQPVTYIHQDSSSDNEHVFLVRGDGTGNMFRCTDSGTTRFRVEDGGTVNTRGSGVKFSTKEVSSNYTIAQGDTVVAVNSFSGGSPVTITLPEPEEGRVLIIHDGANFASVRNVTVARDSTSDYIDGSLLNKTYNTNSFRVMYIASDDQWFTFEG